MEQVKVEDGGPAFPITGQMSDDGKTILQEGMPGMTLRDFAAINLRVPNSGRVWLDEMITESNRAAFAAAALTGLLSDASRFNTRGVPQDVVDATAETAYKFADASLKARGQ